MFPQGIVVTCIPDYALDETARDDNNYEVKCKADASFEYSHHMDGKSRACLPIVCGTFPSIADAEVRGSALFTRRLRWLVTAAARLMRHRPRPARNMSSVARRQANSRPHKIACALSA